MECLICLRENQKFIQTQCGHKIHDKCLQKIINSEIKKCPWCRRPYSYKEHVLIEKCVKCNKLVYECNCEFFETIVYFFAVLLNILFLIYFLKN